MYAHQKYNLNLLICIQIWLQYGDWLLFDYFSFYFDNLDLSLYSQLILLEFRLRSMTTLQSIHLCECIVVVHSTY